jgi:hypothetical protein
VSVTQEIFGRFCAAQYSYLTELTVQNVLQPGYDYGDEFESGLGLILDGLRATVDRLTGGSTGRQGD